MKTAVTPRYTNESRPPLEQFALKARQHAETSKALCGARSFEIFSTRRQITRYREWFRELTGNALDPIYATVELVFDLLPESEKPDWDY